MNPISHLSTLLLAVCVASAGTACKRDNPADQLVSARPAQPSPQPRVLELAAADTLDTNSAFDLIPTLDGATLVWARQGSRALLAQRFSRAGELKGKPDVVLQERHDSGRVTDLVATRLDAGTAVAWVEQLGNEARALAVIADSRSASKPMDLGAAWYTAKNVRGNLALAAAQEFALAFVRGPLEPCAQGGRECFGFALYRISRDGRAHARGLPLSVPVPCSQNSTHLAVSEEHWVYGVCSLVGSKRVTTVFDIQFNPEYAEAVELLESCTPLGLFEYRGRIWLSGECGGKRQASALVEPPQTLQLSSLALVCQDGAAVLRAPGVQLRLEQPRGALQVLLGEPLIPRGGRAVWTGRALLVAYEQDRRVRVIRHGCQ